MYFSGGTVLTGLKNRQGIHTLHKSTYEICRKHIYVEQGSVSKTELRLEDIKKASSSDILDRLSKAIGEMTMNKSRSSDRKSHKMIMGKIGKKMKGILYLGMDNMSWLDSGSIVPFVPSVK